MTLAPRAVLVHRRTELQELLERHGTYGQATFFLQHLPLAVAVGAVATLSTEK